MMVDAARNFRQPATLRRLIDQMSAYKLNRLHVHLSDDEGWRIEIPGLPELIEIGAKRCHDITEMHCLLPQLGSGPDDRSGGRLSEPRRLCRAGALRGGSLHRDRSGDRHARPRARRGGIDGSRYPRLHAQGNEAGASAYRLLDPANTSNTTTVQFYDRRSFLNLCSGGAQRFASKVIVIGEIAYMHREAGASLSIWHFGGDEAKNILLGAGFQPLDGTDPGKGHVNLAAQDKPWGRSPQCAALIASGKAASVDELPSMFARQVSQIVRANGAGTMAAWQDGIKHTNGPQDFATAMVTMWDTMFWGASDTVQTLANQGYKTVLALPDYLYFDFPYSFDQRERGYYWGSHVTDSFKTFALAPDNLPQNAEIMADRDGNPFEATGTGGALRIEGIQGQAWAEVCAPIGISSIIVYPRLLALAERAWHRAAWERPYAPGERYRLGDTDKVDKAALAQDWARFMSVVQNRGCRNWPAPARWCGGGSAVEGGV